MANLKRRPRRRPNADEDGEEWLLTYSDTVTLLMTFFVLLLSVSTIDQAKFDHTVEGLKDGGIGDKKFVSPFETLKAKLDQVSVEHDLQDAMNVTRDAKGVTIELASSSLYQVGSADIQQQSLEALEAVAKTIKDFEYKKFQVEIEGHTDNVAIHTERYPSNWELSVHRATNIVKFLSNEGIEDKRMKAAGYADTRPKVPNVDETGSPIPSNQATNRRIVIHVVREE